jgi:hypothetical protein
MSGPAVVTSASTNTKDTIYIAKETASIPEKIYDTIYIASSSNKNVQQKASVNLPGRASQSQGLDKTNGETIPVLSIKAMGHKPNIQKGNSMKDDSLLTRYTFVTL